jgi:hypothetical protein
MVNTIKIADLIMKETKRVFKNNIPFIGSMTRNYDDYHKVLGAKEGESIRILKPMKYSVRSGKTMDVQDHTETEATLTKATIRGVDLKFSWQEAVQYLENGEAGTQYFLSRKIAPAAAILASKVEEVVMTTAYKEVFNTAAIPVTNVDRQDVINCSVILDNYSTPANNRYGVITPKAKGDLLNENSSIYNPQSSISRQYTTGVIGPAYGFDLASSPVVPSMTNGADVAGAVNGASQTGATITMDAMTAAPTEGASCYFGDDVYGLNPVTQSSLGTLQHFVVGSSASTTSLPISPSITVSGNQQTVSAVPDNDDVITFIGSASTAHPQMMFYHQDAFAFGTCDLAVPEVAAGLQVVRHNEDQLAMSFTSGGDIINADTLHRLDIMFGMVTVVPEWACKLFGI